MWAPRIVGHMCCIMLYIYDLYDVVSRQCCYCSRFLLFVYNGHQCLVFVTMCVGALHTALLPQLERVCVCQVV